MKTFTKIWSFLKGRELPTNTRYVNIKGNVFAITPEGEVFFVLHTSTL